MYRAYGEDFGQHGSGSGEISRGVVLYENAHILHHLANLDILSAHLFLCASCIRVLAYVRNSVTVGSTAL